MRLDALKSADAKAASADLTEKDYWYAVSVFTGKEERIKGFIGDNFNDYQLLYPKRLLTIRKASVVKTVEKPLFPGYFFVKTLSSLSAEQARTMIDSCYQRCGTPIKILGSNRPMNGNDKWYAAIPESEMRYILFLTEGGDLIGASSYHKVGGRVRVVSGPLIGHEAIIARVNPRKNRITISLTMFGSRHNIDIGGECLERHC